jgi:hypothetical protein
MKPSRWPSDNKLRKITKFQAPILKEYPNSNDQLPRGIFVWVFEPLVIGIYLEFVIWLLEFFLGSLRK